MIRQNFFTSECLDFYKSLCDCTSKQEFYNKCVTDRLNFLLEDNSKQMDNAIDMLTTFSDQLLLDDQPFNRCENYSRMLKTCSKANLKHLTNIFKTYNKACRMSTVVLKRLTKLL